MDALSARPRRFPTDPLAAPVGHSGDTTKAMTMSSAEAFKEAMAELRAEQAQAIQVHRADSQKLAELTAKLDDAFQGRITDVDMAAMASEVRQMASDLHQGLVDSHTTAVGSTTANADTSVLQGGGTASPDVVSASSPGVVKPDTDIPNSAVPDSLGGGAMPAGEPTSGSTAEKAPDEGVPVPVAATDNLNNGKTGDEVAEPAVPSVDDVPSDTSDTAPKSAKKK